MEEVAFYVAVGAAVIIAFALAGISGSLYRIAEVNVRWYNRHYPDDAVTTDDSTTTPPTTTTNDDDLEPVTKPRV